MGVYLFLLAFLFIISWYAKKNYSNKETQDQVILASTIFLMFLICALRKSTVGIDTAGYEEIYNLTSKLPWNDFDYVYFEQGYILLMKVFSKIGFSFQTFLAFVYSIVFIPVYVFIKKYSKNVTLSLLIYICFIFFTFNLTGIRNSIALSLCLLIVPLLQNKTKMSYIGISLLMIASFYIHKSSIVFLLIIIIGIVGRGNLITQSVFMIAPFILILSRDQIYSFAINNLGKTYLVVPTSLDLGGMLVLYLALLTFSLWSIHFYKRMNSHLHNIPFAESEINSMSIKALMLVVISLFIAGGEGSMNRAALYFQIFIIILIPNIFHLYKFKSRTLLEFSMCVFLVVYYLFTVLLPNTYNVVPYLFYWMS